jgi:hypothetical protein
MLKEDQKVPQGWATHWLNESRYAVTKDGYLVRFEKFLSDGWAVFHVLYEGWWEAPEAVGVTYKEINAAIRISDVEASDIISREERPLSERPEERKYWLSC